MTVALLALAAWTTSLDDVIVRVKFPPECQTAGWRDRMEPDVWTAVCEPPPIPPLEAMPIYASWYNPAWGGINCDHDCTQLAIAPMRDEWYGRVAACPPGFTTRGWTTEFHIAGLGSFLCLDRGGAIKITYRTVYTRDGFQDLWVIVLDFMVEETPPFAAEIFWNWQATMTPVPHFEED